MALSSSVQPSLFTTTHVIVIIFTFLHFFSLLPSLCCSNSNHYHPPSVPSTRSPDTTTSQGLLVVEKTRLGSTPPSCYNKCNKCHPCIAVQVPTLPNHGREQPAALMSSAMGDYYKQQPMDSYNFDSSSLGSGEGTTNRYSNYKPLGWKCRCNGHFYNP